MIYGNEVWEKPLSDDLKFLYEPPQDGARRYEITLEREKTLVDADLLATVVKGKLKRGLARLLTGFKGAYYRLGGKATIKVYDGDRFVESYSSPEAVWELMYFGEPHE